MNPLLAGVSVDQLQEACTSAIHNGDLLAVHHLLEAIVLSGCDK